MEPAFRRLFSTGAETGAALAVTHRGRLVVDLRGGWCDAARQRRWVPDTLTETRFANTPVLSGDVAAAIRELKAKPAGEPQVHGSGTLTRWLLQNDLVDEMNLLVVPVVVGQGTRLLPATGPGHRARPGRVTGLPEINYAPGLPAARGTQPTEARDTREP